MLLVNLGCGNTYHKNWLNIDFISNSKFLKSHDLRRGIPLEDNTVDVVYHSHVLEHFTKEDGKAFIGECYRVLKPNGIIRIAVPDLETIAREYIKNLDLADENDSMAEMNYEWITTELFDQMVRNKSGGSMISYLSNPNLENEKYVYQRWGYEAKNLRSNLLQEIKKNEDIKTTRIVKQSFFKKFKRKFKNGVLKLFDVKAEKLSPEDREALQIGKFRVGGEVHQWMYDRYSLKKLLLESGFCTVKIKDGYNSEIPNWEKYHLDLVDGEVRKPDSLFMEARKV